MTDDQARPDQPAPEKQPGEATPPEGSAPAEKQAGGATPPAAPAKPAAPAAKPAAAAKPPAKPAPPAVMQSVPWQSEMADRLKQRFGSGVREAATYLGQNFLVAERSVAKDILRQLCHEEQFDYLVDVTAVHYPKKDLPFEIVWILYSFPRNERVRVKTSVFENEPAPSVVDLWPTANWLEREAYDMFGVSFEGHPDLRRILMPDEWKGHPLRKDYSIIQQDKEWVQINLGIESGQ